MDQPTTDSPSNSNLNKVNSNEFDPLQEKNLKNGTEDASGPKEPPKPPTPQVPPAEGNSRPQSATMATTPSQQQAAVTSGAHSSGMGDYFGRSTAAGSFPNMQYGSLPYPQQYSFQTG